MTTNLVDAIEVVQLEPKYLHEAELVMAAVCHDAFQLGDSANSFKNELERMGEFEDIRNAQKVYFENGGTFLLLIMNGKVIGMGGIKRLSSDVCEIKKAWILKEYRAQGYGALLSKKLEEFAISQNYKKMRLEFWFPDKQSRIIAIARKQGFYEIEPYRKSGAKISMEKCINGYCLP